MYEYIVKTIHLTRFVQFLNCHKTLTALEERKKRIEGWKVLVLETSIDMYIL